MVQNASGYAAANPILRFSSGPVRYADGIVKLMTNDLESDGFGLPWGQTRSWTNATGITGTALNGTGWIMSQLPFLVSANQGGNLLVVTNGVNVRDFTVNDNGTFTEDFFLQEKLTYSSTNKQYTLTDTVGDKIVFWDFSASNPAKQQGQFQSFTDPGGNTVTVTSRDGAGRPTEVQRSVTIGGTTTTESLLYSYNASNLISNVTLRRKVGTGSWTTIRQVAYTYYASGEAHGSVNDLKLAQIEDGAANVLDTKYYRYWTTGDSGGGYVDALRFVFNAQSYARLVAALGTNVSSLTDTQVLPYADNYFEYDSMSQRVTKEIVQGQGCSSCSGGQGTYLFAYANSTFGSGYNIWSHKTTETLPDGNENIVYTNYAGEVILSVFHDTTANLKWDTFFKYDSLGRPILEAMPSAVTGYDDIRNPAPS